MIKKLLDKWKHEWWVKHSSDVVREYESKKIELISKLEKDMKINVEKFELQRDVIYAKVKAEIKKGEVLEEEVAYRLKNLEERKLELIQSDNDLKSQIKLLEAKAHPSGVWTEAFTLGVSKCWEMVLPVMSENLDKLKSKMKDDAIHEAIARLRAPNKK